ncbi:HDOD domain-containing protein [Marinobacter bohaiensis]|uniref:HDOD domain-containing protein n=1 Tax=Marinobacter bohaiensis TaxID=2201898 RepID=UPI000DAE4ACE|nr:HDOD domain-containing protein [Marinobacter bohaiensis]
MTRAHNELPADSDLPSLPHVVLQALDACRGNGDYREIGRIISADTGLCARVLALANSALYGRAGDIQSIEQALLRLGIQQVQALVITASLRQLTQDPAPDCWQPLRDFWRHSLTTALTARALGRLTGYPHSEEAFLVGLLHNVGELCALRHPPGPTQQALLDNQVAMAVRLASHWGLDAIAVDAIRHQQAPVADIREAGHLAKLINLSSRLAQAEAGGVEAAETLFGLTAALTREIGSRIEHEVTAMAQSLDIPLDGPVDGAGVHRQLANRVIHSALVEQSLGAIPPPSSLPALLGSALNNLATLTGRSCLVFGADNGELRLLAATRTAPPAITVPLDHPRSLVSRVATRRASDILDNNDGTILDRQLLGLLDCPAMAAVPVSNGKTDYGVFVIGLDRGGEPLNLVPLTQLFAERMGALASGLSEPAPNSRNADLDQLARELELRKRVHEVSNPLTIVRQYIHQLQGKMQTIEGTDQLQPDLHVVREELDRAAGLLVRISDAQTDAGADDADHGLVLNDELKLLGDLFEEALFAPNGIDCETQLSRADTRVQATQGPVRQVVINLVRNAVECQPAGGAIHIQTIAPIWQEDRAWVELNIADSGPGLPAAIRRRLFRPVTSDKGEGHRGLGLSIVKQLVDELGGLISCRTGEDGTGFRILLPAAQPNEHPDDSGEEEQPPSNNEPKA